MVLNISNAECPDRYVSKNTAASLLKLLILMAAAVARSINHLVRGLSFVALSVFERIKLITLTACWWATVKAATRREILIFLQVKSNTSQFCQRLYRGLR